MKVKKEHAIDIFWQHLKLHRIFGQIKDYLALVTMYNKFYYEAKTPMEEVRLSTSVTKKYRKNSVTKTDMAFKAVMNLYDLNPDNYFDIITFAHKELSENETVIKAKQRWEKLWEAKRPYNYRFYNFLNFRLFMVEEGIMAKFPMMLYNGVPYSTFDQFGWMALEHDYPSKLANYLHALDSTMLEKWVKFSKSHPSYRQLFNWINK